MVKFYFKVCTTFVDSLFETHDVWCIYNAEGRRLPILMLLYIMLYIVLAYLMLFAALTNAVCLYNASFFAIDFCKCFLFSCFVFVY